MRERVAASLLEGLGFPEADRAVKRHDAVATPWTLAPNGRASRSLRKLRHFFNAIVLTLNITRRKDIAGP